MHFPIKTPISVAGPLSQLPLRHVCPPRVWLNASLARAAQAHFTLRADRALVLAAVRLDGLALRFAAVSSARGEGRRPARTEAMAAAGCCPDSTPLVVTAAAATTTTMTLLHRPLCCSSEAFTYLISPPLCVLFLFLLFRRLNWPGPPAVRPWCGPRGRRSARLRPRLCLSGAPGGP